jgi:hypothetical protein
MRAVISMVNARMRAVISMVNARMRAVISMVNARMRAGACKRLRNWVTFLMAASRPHRNGMA